MVAARDCLDTPTLHSAPRRLGLQRQRARQGVPRQGDRRGVWRGEGTPSLVARRGASLPSSATLVG